MTIKGTVSSPAVTAAGQSPNSATASEEKTSDLSVFHLLLYQPLTLYDEQNAPLFKNAAALKSDPKDYSEFYTRGKFNCDLANFFHELDYRHMSSHLFGRFAKADWINIPAWQKISKKLNDQQLQEVTSLLARSEEKYPTGKPAAKSLQKKVRTHIASAKKYAEEDQLQECADEFQQAKRLLDANHQSTLIFAELHYEFGLVCIDKDCELLAFEAFCIAIAAYPIHAKALAQRASIYVNFASQFDDLASIYLLDETTRLFLNDAQTALNLPRQDSSESLTKLERLELEDLIQNYGPDEVSEDMSEAELDKEFGKLKSQATGKKALKNAGISTSSSSVLEAKDTNNTSSGKPALNSDSNTPDQDLDCEGDNEEGDEETNAFEGDTDEGIDEEDTDETTATLSAKLAEVNSDSSDKSTDPKERYKAEIIRIQNWLKQVAANERKKNCDINALTIATKGLDTLVLLDEKAIAEVSQWRMQFQTEQVRIHNLRAQQEILPSDSFWHYDQSFDVLGKMALTNPTEATKLKLATDTAAKTKLNALLAALENDFKQLKLDSDLTYLTKLYNKAKTFVTCLSEAKTENDLITARLQTLTQHAEFVTAKTAGEKALEKAFQQKHFNTAKIEFQKALNLLPHLPHLEEQKPLVEARLVTIDNFLQTAPNILKEMLRLAGEAKETIEPQILTTLSQRLVTDHLKQQDFTEEKEAQTLMQQLLTMPRGFELFIQLPAIRSLVLPELRELKEDVQKQMLALPHSDSSKICGVILATIVYPDLTYPKPTKTHVWTYVKQQATAKLLARLGNLNLDNFALITHFNSCIDKLHPLLYSNYQILPKPSAPIIARETKEDEPRQDAVNITSSQNPVPNTNIVQSSSPYNVPPVMHVPAQQMPQQQPPLLPPTLNHLQMQQQQQQPQQRQNHYAMMTNRMMNNPPRYSLQGPQLQGAVPMIPVIVTGMGIPPQLQYLTQPTPYAAPIVLYPQGRGTRIPIGAAGQYQPSQQPPVTPAQQTGPQLNNFLNTDFRHG